jgi:hypothetical protein
MAGAVGCAEERCEPSEELWVLVGLKRTEIQGESYFIVG